ncbi:MAG TPA: hypothetical protein VF929_08035 [Gemmatimonadaceae bacterium]
MTTESFLAAFCQAILSRDFGRAEGMLAPWLRSELPGGGLREVVRLSRGEAPPASEYSTAELPYGDPRSMRETVADNADMNGARSLDECDGLGAAMGPPSYPIPDELTDENFESAHRLEFQPDEDLEADEDFSYAFYVAVVQLGEKQAIGYLEPMD